MSLYHDNFVPSEQGSEPEALVTTSVLCADTDEAAEALAASFDLAWLRLSAGRPSVFPSLEEARAYPYTAAERAQIQSTRARLILGSPQTVRATLCALAGMTQATEIMATTFAPDHETRKHSYTLLAEALGSAG